LLDAVRGGGAFRHSPDLTAIAKELQRKPVPTPSRDSCGHLAPIFLREAYGELTGLVSLLAEYASSLRSAPGTANRGNDLALSAPADITLTDRLGAAAAGFKRLKGLAVRALSIVILRVEYGGLEAKVSDQIDRIVETSRDDMLAGDYGRILQVKGVHILYDAPARPLAARIDAAQPLFERAVKLLPALSESWANLAMIAVVRGDCTKAVELAEKSANAASDDSTRREAEEMRDRFRKDVETGKCEADAKRMSAALPH